MLEFALYSKTGAYRRTITPLASHVELLWNAVSTAEIVLDDDAPLWDVLEPGDRVRVMVDGVRRMAGPWVRRSIDTRTRTRTLLIEDDFREFRNPLWPVPSATIAAQIDEYRVLDSVTETLVKTACTEASVCLGLGWTVAPNTGLGDQHRVEFRFHPLIDKLAPLCISDRLTWSIIDKTVDVTAGNLFPRILTPESGVLGHYEWSETAPPTTDVVVGGEGQGSERRFERFKDAARTAKWGFTAQTFKDARSAQDVPDLAPQGAEAIAEGDGQITMRADLHEATWFRYGTYLVGDRVRIQPRSDTDPVTEVIRRVSIAETPDQGAVVTPTIGPIASTPMTVLGSQIAVLARGLRDVRRT